MNPIVLKHSCMGFGEAIAMEPTIRYWRERGHQVLIEARNPKLAALIGLLGAEQILWDRPLPKEAIPFYLEGRVCMLEVSVTVGNRAKGHFLSCGPPQKLLMNGYTRPRLCQSASLPSVPEIVHSKMKDRVFVQLYGAEPYKAPSDQWYVAFLDQMHQCGIKGFSILDHSAPIWRRGSSDHLRFPIPADFVLLEEDDVVKALSIFRLARAAVVLDSLWLQASGLLDKHALALCGPYTSPGRIEDFKNVTMVPNSCPNAPCWRNSHRMCLLTDSACKCLDPPMGVILPLLMEVLKGVE